MYAKLNKLKKNYMDRKLSMLKSMETNENQMSNLEKQEEEMIQKLQTTFNKFNEFTEQSSTFDNITHNIISNINYSRKHLKPLSKNEGKSLEGVYDSNTNIQISKSNDYD